MNINKRHNEVCGLYAENQSTVIPAVIHSLVYIYIIQSSMPPPLPLLRCLCICICMAIYIYIWGKGIDVSALGWVASAVLEIRESVRILIPCLCLQKASKNSGINDVIVLHCFQYQSEICLSVCVRWRMRTGCSKEYYRRCLADASLEDKSPKLPGSGSGSALKPSFRFRLWAILSEETVSQPITDMLFTVYQSRLCFIANIKYLMSKRNHSTHVRPWAISVF